MWSNLPPGPWRINVADTDEVLDRDGEIIAHVRCAGAQGNAALRAIVALPDLAVAVRAVLAVDVDDEDEGDFGTNRGAAALVALTSAYRKAGLL